MPRILVIIPAYNEEAAILSTVNAVREHCPEADYVVINDCSRDSTLQVLRENDLNYISLPMNLGIGGGVQTGYRYALQHDYDVAVQFDGDGQHRADFIRAITQPVLNGECDMCIGSRFVPNDWDDKGFQSSAMRRVGIRLISGLIRLMTGRTILDTTSGFRACNRELIRFFSENYAQDYPEPEAIVTSLVAGYRVKETPVRMNERQGGQSSIRALKSAYYMIKVSLAVIIAGAHISGRKRGGRL